MNDIPQASPDVGVEAKPRGRPPKPKTIPVKLYNDVWIDDGEGNPVRLRTNIKKLDADGKPIFDAKKGDYIKEQVIHELPIDVAKIVLAEKKGERADPLPGDE